MWPTFTLGLVAILAGLNGCHCLLESALVADLLKNYDNNVIPTTKTDPKITVEHGLNLIRILGMEDDILELDAWVIMMWADSRLKWNPADYNNVTRTNLFEDQLWVPDIISWNFKPEGVMLKGIRAVVEHTGLVTMVPPVRLISYCGVSTEDEVSYHCSITFGSWTYAGSVLDVENTGGVIAFSDYYESPHWEIMNSTVVRQSATYDCCPDEHYPNLQYTLKLKPKHHRHHCK